MTDDNLNKESGEGLTIAHLAADIRQLAFEVNNLAITVGAMIEVLDVDKDALRTTARNLYEAAIAKQEGENTANTDKLSAENIEASGEATHPPNAVIFSAPEG